MHEIPPSEAARLDSMGLLQHAKIKRDVYLRIARDTRTAITTLFQLLNNRDDTIDIIAVLIKKTDLDLQGFGLDDKTLDEACRLLAKTVYGHEDEDQSDD